MDNVKNDAYYIGKVFDDLAFIIRHMKDVDSEAFAGNEILQDSMMLKLYLNHHMFHNMLLLSLDHY